MTLLHTVSIFLAVVTCMLALKMVFEKKRYIGVFWAATFGLFIFYDLNRSLAWGLPREFMDTILLIAMLCALFAMWHLSSKRG